MNKIIASHDMDTLPHGLGSGLSAPNVFSYQSTSLEEARARISNLFCPHKLERVGPPSESNVIVKRANLIDTSVNLLTHGCPVRIKPERYKSFYLLQTPLSGSVKVSRGAQKLDVYPGACTVSGPDEEMSMEWSENCVKLIFQIDRTALESVYQAITGISLRGPLRFEEVVSFEKGPMRSVWNIIKMISSDLLENEGSIFQSRFAMQQAEQTILYALLNSDIHLQNDWQNRNIAGIAPHQIRIVEDYIHEHVGDPITIEKLTEISGVSARTLFDNFKKFRGTTPMRYIRDLRMKSAREQLMNPNLQDTVTSIAMQWGFSQLGRFAVIYKDEYGESPSQTLKRSRYE